MTRYQYEDPVVPDPDYTWDQQKSWIRQRWKQLEEHFDGFLTSMEGRFYVLFGGCRAGKTSLLKTIHYQFPPRTLEAKKNCRSVFIDLKPASDLSSLNEFFRLLYEEIREQLGVCSIDPGKVASFFQDEKALQRKMLIELRKILSERFNVNELQTLCFDLDVKFDALPGQGSDNKARELISHLERRDRIPELVEIGKQLRPDISWDDVFQVPPEKPQKALSDFATAFDLIVNELNPTSTRLILLLDNANTLAQTSFVSELFNDFENLFSSPHYTRTVTRQLDIVVAGCGPLYDALLKTKFSRQLKHWYDIQVFPEDITRALIADLPVIENQPDLVEKIARYTGGQPYLLQYFMAQLEFETSIDQSVTDDTIEQVAAACLEPDSAIESWFRACSTAIEGQGSHPVYAALATGQAMSWPKIKDTIQERQLGDTAKLLGLAAHRALDALVFYGLVRHNQVGETSEYTITNELFRQWFVDNVLSLRGNKTIES
jgi:hypothetical protein